MATGRTASLTLAMLLAATSSVALAQAPTLAERVEAAGGQPVTISVMRDVYPVPLADLAAAADLIVEARLQLVRSCVSDDGTTVWTDYQVLPSRVLHSRGWDAAPVPGPRPPLTLGVPVGQLTIEGVQVTVTDAHLKPIRNGATFLLFARREPHASHRMALAGSAAGLFEVDGDRRLVPLFKRTQPDIDVDGATVDDVAKKIGGAVRGK